GPDQPARLDWEATLAFRHHLWDLGLGVADAMDTAQRGMGLDWPATAELIQPSGAEAVARGAALACGVNTDQLTSTHPDLESVASAYEEQLDVVQNAGATPVIMASRVLAAGAQGPQDYTKVYGHLLRRADRPVTLHWLGTAFAPALAGYGGYTDPAQAVEPVAELITEHAEEVEGIKVSLLDSSLEVRLRRLLPEGVRLYTGDDFQYPALILGDAQGHSDALRGIFAAIAPAAAAGPAPVRRADLLLQDRCCLPVLAQRSPERLSHGRGVAQRPRPAPSGADRAFGRQSRGVVRPRSGHRAYACSFGGFGGAAVST